MFLLVFVCLCVSKITRKVMDRSREANTRAPIPGAPDRLSPDFYPGDG